MSQAAFTTRRCLPCPPAYPTHATISQWRFFKALPQASLKQLGLPLLRTRPDKPFSLQNHSAVDSSFQVSDQGRDWHRHVGGLGLSPQPPESPKPCVSSLCLISSIVLSVPLGESSLPSYQYQSQTQCREGDMLQDNFHHSPSAQCGGGDSPGVEMEGWGKGAGDLFSVSLKLQITLH